MAKRNKCDFPMGSEFSPTQINLKTVLEIAQACDGDRHRFDVQVHSQVMPNRTFKTSQNCRLSMVQYRIIDDDTKLTKFGQKLFDIRESEEELYSELAKHILENLNGYNLLNAVRELNNSGEAITLITLAQRLQEKGLYVPETGTHLSKMKLWLERAGVLSGWTINEQQLQLLTGVKNEDIELLKGLTVNQRAFLSSLISLEQGLSKEIAKHAVMTRQIQYNEKSLANDIVNPLERKGLIHVTKASSGKSTLITPTELLRREVMLPLLISFEKEINSELHVFLEKPLEQILLDVDSENTYIKGLALEALAVRLMRSINLKYSSTRLRGTATGGAEVDVIFESNGSQQLFFSRWQVQCKNTKRVSLEDVAKEVGLTVQLKSNVIVIITTGTVGESARTYSKSVMSNSGLVIIFIDGNDLQVLKTDLGYMRTLLERETGIAASVK